MLPLDFVLWDFNGTLLDDVAIGIESINPMLKKRGLPPLRSVEEYQRVFGFPIEDYYRRVGFDFEKEPFDDLAKEWVANYLALTPQSVLYDGVTEVLEYFRKKAVLQIILSATEVGMLEKQLEQLHIRSYFAEVLGLDNIHAGSKEKIAVDWMKNHPHLLPQRGIFFGDSRHDAEVAKAIGVPCVLLSQGHESKETLSVCGLPILEKIGQIPIFLEEV